MRGEAGDGHLLSTPHRAVADPGRDSVDDFFTDVIASERDQLGIHRSVIAGAVGVN